MGLDEVVGDILAAARAKADAIISEAESERGRMLEQARESARLLREERLREAGRVVAQLRVRELSAAELEVKRARLAMERDLLEAATSGARARVAALPPAEDEALLSAILRKGAAPGFRIYSAKRNEPFLRNGSPFPYAGSTSCLGGLVFESADGSVRMDYTYDAVLRETVERTMRDIYGVLFAR
jgi:V/A-type H+-transporting ATPase subunit E